MQALFKIYLYLFKLYYNSNKGERHGNKLTIRTTQVIRAIS
jgi:hypothetical protein